MGKKIKLVDIKKYGFLVEPRYFFYGWTKSPKIFGRESAVKALVVARALLPKGYNFRIWNGQRSRSVSLLMLESFKRRMRVMYPQVSRREQIKLAIKFGGPAPVRVARLDTHRHGGAFDLTIIDRQGSELYMNTHYDNLTNKAEMDFFEKKKKLTLIEREAKKNRRLLKLVMKKAGFKNHAAEWWHWSYNK
jgi:D-alanyl-D-alanine dipeptidase